MGFQVAGAHQFVEHVIIQPDVVKLHDEPVTGGLRPPEVAVTNCSWELVAMLADISRTAAAHAGAESGDRGATGVLSACTGCVVGFTHC